MAIRITVKWTNIQKFLSIIEGILDVSLVEGATDICLYQCNVKISSGSTSFSKIEGQKGIPTLLSNLLHDELRCMLDSYYQGFILSDHIYHWVENSFGYDKLSTWGRKRYRALSKESKVNFRHQCFSQDANVEKEIVKTLKELQKNVCPKPSRKKSKSIRSK